MKELAPNGNVIVGETFLPMNDQMSILHKQMEDTMEHSAELGTNDEKALLRVKRDTHQKNEEAIKEEKIAVKENREVVWKVPVEVIDSLNGLISTADAKDKIKLRVLLYDLTGNTNKDSVLGFIQVAEGLSDENRKKLEVLAGGEVVSDEESTLEYKPNVGIQFTNLSKNSGGEVIEQKEPEIKPVEIVAPEIQSAVAETQKDILTMTRSERDAQIQSLKGEIAQLNKSFNTSHGSDSVIIEKIVLENEQKIRQLEKSRVVSDEVQSMNNAEEKKVEETKLEEAKIPEVKKIETEKISPEELKEQFIEARQNFIEKVTEYRENLQTRRKKFEELTGQLGATGRHAPELAEPADLVNAREMYQTLRTETLRQTADTYLARLANTESEQEKLRLLSLETFSPVEQGILNKLADKYKKTPVHRRVAVAETLLAAAANETEEMNPAAFPNLLKQKIMRAEGVTRPIPAGIDGVKRKAKETVVQQPEIVAPVEEAPVVENIKTELTDFKFSPLESEFQFDTDKTSKLKRKNFMIKFEESLIANDNFHCDKVSRIKYKGADMYAFILQKGDDVEILLGGQKIGHAKISSEGVKTEYDAPVGDQKYSAEFKKAFEEVALEIQKNPYMFVKETGKSEKVPENKAEFAQAA